MRIVIDTMVAISGASLSNSPSSQIIKLWGKDALEIASSEAILSELRRVMHYPEIQKNVFPFTEKEINYYVKKFRQGAYIVPGKTLVDVSPDPKDNMFFVCALEAQVDYIVSKDKHHILPVGSYNGIKVVPPHVFIEEVMSIRNTAW